MPQNPAPVSPADWRKQQRQALIHQRMAADKETLSRWQQAIDGHLELGFPQLQKPDARVALYWPHRGEYDPRALAMRLRKCGTTILLPVVVGPAAPLEFRAWNSDTELVIGPHGITQPAKGPACLPTAILAPAVGFDEAGYRLGYGGGYFDRTLAALQPRPLLIGCAHELARMPTLHPQPHDIPMDYVATEAGVYRREAGRLVKIA